MQTQTQPIEAHSQAIWGPVIAGKGSGKCLRDGLLLRVCILSPTSNPLLLTDEVGSSLAIELLCRKTTPSFCDPDTEVCVIDRSHARKTNSGPYLGFDTVLSLPECIFSCCKAGFQRRCLLCLLLPVRERLSCRPSVAVDGSPGLLLHTQRRPYILNDSHLDSAMLTLAHLQHMRIAIGIPRTPFILQRDNVCQLQKTRGISRQEG